jgi:hypothetical protein
MEQEREVYYCNHLNVCAMTSCTFSKQHAAAVVISAITASPNTLMLYEVVFTMPILLTIPLRLLTCMIALCQYCGVGFALSQAAAAAAAEVAAAEAAAAAAAAAAVERLTVAATVTRAAVAECRATVVVYAEEHTSDEECFAAIRGLFDSEDEHAPMS